MCTYEEPTKCPSLNGTECGGHGECNNLNQCHCDKDWGSDLCVDFGGGGGESYIFNSWVENLVVYSLVELNSDREIREIKLEVFDNSIFVSL